ncbi:MAG: amino acid--[acyl-carrier-protein] ligase [Gemmatimonadota bacterium]
MGSALEAGYDEYREALLAHRLLYATGVPGVYGRSGVFEDTIDRLNRLVTRFGAADGAEVMHFPPILNRHYYEKSEHLKSFPQLAGIVHSFDGTDKDHQELLRKQAAGEDWSAGLPHTDVVLTPAACYPVYPTIAARGPLSEAGAVVDVLSFCFRHEPSPDPARMQMFRQREHVRIGAPAVVQPWRDTWFERAQQFTDQLGLPARPEVANDPFFGRAGKMLAVNQRDQQLKFEIVVPICSVEKPTAVISLNYHQDHFGLDFGIQTHTGDVSHTACIGFGLERLTLALFKTHGLERDRWPAGVRGTLEL